MPPARSIRPRAPLPPAPPRAPLSDRRNANNEDFTHRRSPRKRKDGPRQFRWSPRRPRRPTPRRGSRGRRSGCGATIAAGTSRPVPTTTRTLPRAPRAGAPLSSTPRSTNPPIPRDRRRRRCVSTWPRSRPSSRTSCPGYRSAWGWGRTERRAAKAPRASGSWEEARAASARPKPSCR